MKKLIVIVLLICIASILTLAEQRGITEDTGFLPKGAYIMEPAVKGYIPTTTQVNKYYHKSPWDRFTDDWNLLITETFDVSVPSGIDFTILFDPGTETIDFIDYTTPVSTLQQAAIERAPAWLRQDLYDNFRRLSLSFLADVCAQQILGAPDPYVDEVAFIFANLGPGYFNNDIYFQLPLECAEDVYALDEALDYVQIVDYGDSNDDDYYSTCVYTIKEENGEEIEVEVDKYYYYWFVVHPKLSDEVPTYINPETGNPADPPYGVFWRDYLWNHADAGYPLLSEQFAGVEYLWDRSNTETDAIDIVNQWISDVMEWNVGGERPIQPVRIYHLHMGYCGEHQDIRGAAGRIALIPSNCTSNGCEDHVWNEFWERGWIHWDGGDINNPLLYENGWGKTLSGVYSWKGNGYTWNCAERYSADVCTLYVNIFDSEGKPADGVNIRIYSDDYYGYGVATAARGTTPANGQSKFLLGDNQDYYIRLDGPLGSYPPAANTYVDLIEGSIPNETYYWEYTYDEASNTLSITEGPPNPSLDEYKMEIEFQCINETVYGQYFTNNEFGEEMETGWVDFFFADEPNYSSYMFYQPFEGYNISPDASQLSSEFELTSNETWYAVLSTRELSINRPLISGTVNIYTTNTGINEIIINNVPAEFSLHNACPNPFNVETTISFDVAKNADVRISVFNLNGQFIETLIDGYYSPGKYSLQWDAGGLATGIYLVSMQTNDETFTQKICLLK